MISVSGGYWIMYDVIFFYGDPTNLFPRKSIHHYMVNGPIHVVLGQPNEILKRGGDGDER
ncbi:MAG: hypothetical protein CM15mP82_4320 [Methanobacteriota archaeon]|nr:MAG: hypothetical protein CM15mP82_4320 [Euryarchaeota archaeon]